MGLFGTLALIFIVLKLTSVIAWSWWLVLLPLIILPIVCLICVIRIIIEQKRWIKRCEQRKNEKDKL